MAKLPTTTSASSSEDEGSSSSDEEQPAPTQPAPRTPTKSKEEEEESEDESEAESEEESGEEEDEDKDDGKKPQPSALTLSKPASESGGSESESEGSDSDLVAAKLVTPISSRPMAEAPVEKTNGTTHFQRIWTLDDEIVVLNNLLQFQSDKGLVKVTNALIGGEFYDIVKKKLSIEVTGSQLVDKLRSLKRKYLAIADRAKSGEPFQFAKPHDEAVYELGKKIWVRDDESEGRVPNGVAADGGGGTVGSLNLKEKFPFLKDAVEGMGKRFAEEGFEMMDPTKAGAFDKRVKSQKIAEMKLGVHELELWKETLKLIMEGVEKAN